MTTAALIVIGYLALSVVASVLIGRAFGLRPDRNGRRGRA